MILLAVRVAVGVALLVRGGSSRTHQIAAGVLLPKPFRTALTPVVVVAVALDGWRRERAAHAASAEAESGAPQTSAPQDTRRWHLRRPWSR